MENYEFNEIELLSAVAVGVPGKRTFFLAIGDEEEWIRLWLEKEQLEALTLAVVQLLVTLEEEFNQLPEEPAKPLTGDIPANLPSAELETGEIGIGFDDDKAILEFTVQTVGPQQTSDTHVSCHATLGQLEVFGDQAREVCAAGRPRCKLCGAPIDPTGHICPRQN